MRGASLYDAAPIDLATYGIRLLELKPVAAAGDQTTPIHCSLRTVVLDRNCPAYTALSHSSSASEPLREITIDNNRVLIRENLYTFLQSVRRRLSHLPPSDVDQRVQPPQLFWVDALCINAEDIAERNHQARLMGYIYSQVCI